MSPEIAGGSARSAERKLIPFPRRSTERRTRHELEFLPAALEIIETPTSTAGRIMMGAIGALVLAAILWACLGRLDIVATATGRIVPSGQIKVIQPLDIGVVKKIMVAGGDHVRAGQVLVELDPTTDQADRARIARDLMQARLDVGRLRAVLAGDAAAFVPTPGADPALVDAERRQLAAQLAGQRARLDQLDQQIAAKTAERGQATAMAAKYAAAVPLLQQKEGIYQQLYGNMLSSKISLLDAERDLVAAAHDRDAAQHQAEEAAAEIAALTQQRRETEADFRRQALDALGKASEFAAEQRAELIKATERASRQVLRAPVAGTVEQLSVHTIGGVVQPAQTLMVVVPDNVKLEVEALLPNRDAGFVHAGQPAEIKVEAFTYTRYGLLHGRVRHVSRDALQSERDAPSPDRDRSSMQSEAQKEPGAGDSAYVARISLAETAMETEQGRIPLEPGMTVTAEIKTGERRLISYLLSPFMRYRHEALRER
jgi:hemolysin D